jgi:branched-chain amino acid transport system substrate-binding protein
LLSQTFIGLGWFYRFRGLRGSGKNSFHNSKKGAICMKEKKGEKGRFTGRRFIRTSLIVAAGIIVAAAIVAGPFLASSMAAEAQTSQKPIKLALFGVTSGPIGMSGEACRRGVEMWVDEINGKGGLLGRKVEFVQRDTRGKPEEAVRYAREFAAAGDTDFLFAHGSSAEAFAVAAVSKDLKKLTFVALEATEFTADPKVRSRYCIRAGRNTLLDDIASGVYLAKKSKELGLTRWYTIAEDYAYGRDTVNVCVEFLKKFNPDVQIVGQAWPKLGEPDYTPNITAIMAAQPDAVFNALYADDMTNFLKQAVMFRLSDKTKSFYENLNDYPLVDAIKKGLGKFPAGLDSGMMYVRTYPDTKANHDFNDAHVKRYGSPPIHWTWETYTSCRFIEEAVKKAKTTETEAVIRALKDLTVKAPTGVGPNGTVTLRGRDNQLINYAVAWGVTISQEPYLTDIVPASWDQILKEETAWLKDKGWLQ